MEQEYPDWDGLDHSSSISIPSFENDAGDLAAIVLPSPSGARSALGWTPEDLSGSFHPPLPDTTIARA